MPLSTYELRTSIAVSDIQNAVAFYEGKLGLRPLESGPSADIAGGSRVYGSGGGPALNVYQSDTAGNTPATLATWYVDDLDQIVDELGVVRRRTGPLRQFEHDPKGITARAGGGRIAWFQDRTATPSPSKPTCDGERQGPRLPQQRGRLPASASSMRRPPSATPA